MPRATFGRVTVRNQPSERGLSRVVQSPRGFIVSVNGKRVGAVAFARSLFEPNQPKPWFWYVNLGLGSEQQRNTADNGCYYATKEEARDACIEWTKATLRRLANPQPKGIK